MEVQRRSLGRKIAYWAFMGFLSILLLEFLLGIFFWVKDRNASIEDVHDEPYLYYLYNDGDDTNEHGFKTPYTIEKPWGVYRIVLVGGSVARGKAMEESIAHYLEQELRQRYNTDNIQVVNAGISGYVLQQEFLLIQNILQEYDPDLIIGLDGYNDLLTYYLNQSMDTYVPLPPHQYRDFRVIKDGRFRSKPYSRFAYFFKNINRVKEAMVRKRDLGSQEWLNGHRDDVCGTFCNNYWRLTDDIELYCRAKGIFYVQFVQPVNFKAALHFNKEAKPIIEGIYAKVDTAAKPRPYAFSLVNTLATEDSLFYDDVHLIPEGHQRVAGAMADSLAPVFYQLFR